MIMIIAMMIRDPMCYAQHTEISATRIPAPRAASTDSLATRVLQEMEFRAAVIGGVHP